MIGVGVVTERGGVGLVWLGRLGAEGDDFALLVGEAIAQIGPGLHHGAAIFQVFGLVVSSAHGVPFGVGELALDDIGAVAQFVQEGREGAAETVGAEADTVFAVEAHPFQRPVEGGGGHALVGGAIVGEEEAAAAGVGVKFVEQGHRLPGEGDEVRLAHLHAAGGYAPLGCVQVQFFPACRTQFDGADGSQEHQAEGDDRGAIAAKGFQLGEELGDLGPGQRCVVLGLGAMDGALKGCRGVAIGAQGGDGIAVDGRTPLADQEGNGFGAPPFHAADDLQEVGRGHSADGELANVGEDIGLKEAFDLSQVDVGPTGAFPVDPFPRHGLEGVGVVGLEGQALGLAVVGGVDAPDDQGTAFGAFGAGLRQGEAVRLAAEEGLGLSFAAGRLCIFAEGEDIFFVGDPVAVAPELGAGGADFQVQPLAVSQFDGLVAGPGVADFGVGEGHGAAGIVVWIPATIPAIRPDDNG